RNDEHRRARRQLCERVAVHELARGDPPVHRHDLALQLGNHAEPAADTDQAQPEKRPRHQEQIAHARPPAGASLAAGRWSQRPIAVMTTMTSGVLNRNGPTATNVTAAMLTARTLTRAGAAMPSGVTATSPTTAALRPRISGATSGVSPRVR